MNYNWKMLFTKTLTSKHGLAYVFEERCQTTTLYEMKTIIE